jgi:hypothetical protein
MMRQELAANPASITDRGRIGRRLAAAEALLDKAKGEVTRDPLAWDARVGMAPVVPFGTVDISKPGAIETWGAARVAQADETARRHGLAQTVFLQPVEKRALAKAFEQGGDKGLSVITAVRRAFGDRTEAVLAEIGREAPGGALLADLALKTGPTPAVNDAAEGLALKAQKGHKPVAPARNRAVILADEVTGRSLGYATDYLQQAMKVADAIYETRAYREGKTEAVQDDIYKKALAEAFGEHEMQGRKYGGLVKARGGLFSSQKVVIPPTMAQDKAADIFAALTPEDVGNAPRHRNGAPLTRRELSAATLITVAPGKYLVSLGDPARDPKWATGPDGRAYVLDIEAALPSIQRRRPDLR